LAAGTIKWFTPEKRFGFIDPDKDSRILFVHHKFVSTPNLETFEKGVRVTYEPFEGPKGLEARNVRYEGSIPEDKQKNNLEILCGFSECNYDSNTSKLLVRGWFLGAEVDRVNVCLGNNRVVAQAKFGFRRSDVFEQYPQYNNPSSGWKFEDRVDESVTEEMEISVHIFSYASLIRKLKKKIKLIDTRFTELPNKVLFENKPPVDNTLILEQLMNYGINTRYFTIDFEEYFKWFEMVDYPRNYPKYVAEFPEGLLLAQKSLQHYLSIKLMGIQSEGIYMDIASSNSVFPDIVLKYYGLQQVYKQDIKYKKGIHGNRVGGNAASLPLPNESIDHMALHCSWEHFEGNSDIEFLHEVGRLLKKGGRVCIIPLYLANEFLIQTSTCMWGKDSNQDIPVFDKDAILYVREEIRQRCMRSYDVKSLSYKILNAAPANLKLSVYYFENWGELHGCPIFALLGER
jgi:cold shock CspA family protein